MEEEIIQSESLIGVILDQVNMQLVFLARPVVQIQILAIALIFLIALFAPEGFKWWWQRRTQDEVSAEQPFRQKQWPMRIYALSAPVTGLILTNLVIWALARWGYPNGLVAGSQMLFWVWLAYRVLLMILYGRFGQSMRPYHLYVLNPLFLIALLWLLMGGQLAISQIAAVPIAVFNGFTLTVGNLVGAMIILYIFLIAAWIVERLMNRTLGDRLNAEPGMIQSIATLSRYAISALGIIAAMAMLGLDATSLALVAGGLSVGIGIGLQDIIANFVSGLTLLFEQSLRPGDVIELEGKVSRVERVSLRTTIVNTMDNIRMIIPNATLTTQSVTTLTKGDRVVRVLLPLRVAYDANPEQVKEILEQAVVGHPQVLADPAPRLLFRGVGTDSSLDFELSIWTDNPMIRGFIKSDLYFLLFAALAENGIQIPVPRRDLILRRQDTFDFGGFDKHPPNE